MRRIYRFNKESDKVEEVARIDLAAPSGPYVMPDLDVVYNGGFRSPIDDSWISSRKQLRDHNVAHGVRQTGDISIAAGREHNMRKMQHDPAAKSDPNFSWGREPR